MAKPSVGILGMGSIGTRHAKNFMSLGCPVRGYDPATHTGDYRNSILGGSDVVVIATPTIRHYEDIIDCSNHKKPMLVEKPICETSFVRKELMPYVKMVGYNLRFHSCVRKTRDWLGAGLIGKPLWARFTCGQYNDKPAYLRDGVLLNWSHELDLALYLLGMARVMGAHLHLNPEDLADVLLRHDNNGCYSTVHLDYLARPERRGFVIVGERGTIDSDLVSRRATLIDNNGGVVHQHFGRDTFDSNYITEAEAFLERLDGKETIGCTAEEALQVVEIVEEAKGCHRYE